TLSKVAKMMRDLDFCMFTTRTEDGEIHARPMSNNGEVEFDGDVWFFSGADTRKVAEIEAEPTVQLSYADTKQFRFLSMSGTADDVLGSAGTPRPARATTLPKPPCVRHSGSTRRFRSTLPVGSCRRSNPTPWTPNSIVTATRAGSWSVHST